MTAAFAPFTLQRVNLSHHTTSDSCAEQKNTRGKAARQLHPAVELPMSFDFKSASPTFSFFSWKRRTALSALFTTGLPRGSGKARARAEATPNCRLIMARCLQNIRAVNPHKSPVDPIIIPLFTNEQTQLVRALAQGHQLVSYSNRGLLSSCFNYTL